MREKLIELLKRNQAVLSAAGVSATATLRLADLLIDGGVTTPVHCKDCQFAKPYMRVDGKSGYYCQNPKHTFQYGTNWERLFEPIMEADDFCSHGERKDNA